ncbi:MAG: transposase [Candidatus Omnitrophota bacterium]|nr:transposase [Candidatus Omnitrophota bacterium]
MDKRKIFLDKHDYFRFIHNLFVLNEQRVVHTTRYNPQNFEKTQNEKVGDQTGDRASPQFKGKREPRKLLVDIHAFSLMSNHYHLLLSPKIENAIPKFMNKLNMAYAKYFNIKYKRMGTLFESRYKSIPVEKEHHFYHLPYYIHLNPLDIEFPEWREGRLKSYTKAMEFLENYRWSSHPDYTGKKNFPSVTNRNFLLDVFSGEEKYKQSIEQWLKDMDSTATRNKELFLE